MTLGHFRNFSGQGRTASLLDNQIVLIGNNTLSGNEGSYVSIRNPRDGLLAMNYLKETFPSRGSPFHHAALASDNKLTLLGGKYKTRSKLEQNTWTGLKLTWEESQKAFTPIFFSACTLQQGLDLFYVFGGAELRGKTTFVRNTILHINTTSLIVREIGAMNKSRMAFGCDFLNDRTILLSGGYSDPANPVQSIEPDEIITLSHSTSSSEVQYVSDISSCILPVNDSLWRFQHSLIRMNETIFALGGLTTDWKEDRPVQIDTCTTILPTSTPTASPTSW